MPDTHSKTIKVLIAEDMEPIRVRCATILHSDPCIEVVAAVGTGRDAVAQAEALEPDVILMDIEMEERDSGLKAAEAILRRLPYVKIVMLTVYEDDEMVFSAFQLGVCDYMIKNAKPDVVIQGVKDAYLDQSPIRQEIAKKIRNEFKRVKQYESSFLYMLELFTTLTTAEQELLYLLSQGHTRTDICAIRHVELSTIKTQINSILRKFNMRSIDKVVASIENLNLFETVLKKHLK